MKIFLCILILNSPFFVNALIPANTIEIDKTLQPEDLQFLNELFKNKKMSSSLDCEINSKSIRELRKFKNKSFVTESIELTYNPSSYDSFEEKIIISVGNAYGHRISSSITEGVIEEFKITLADYYGSYITLAHDGKGTLTSFKLVDYYQILPCQMKRY